MNRDGTSADHSTEGFETIRSISRKGVTMLLVEQNARLALEASHRGHVMDSSEITSSDDAKSSLANPQVRQALSGE